MASANDFQKAIAMHNNYFLMTAKEINKQNSSIAEIVNYINKITQ